VARNLHEKVFAWIMLGDERDLVESWVAGAPAYRRSARG
jgi:guanine deaminase